MTNPVRVGYDHSTGAVIRDDSPIRHREGSRVLADTGWVAEQNEGSDIPSHEYLDPVERLDVRPDIMLKYDDVSD